MTSRQRRMWAVGLLLTAAAVATALSLQAFRDNVFFFYTPTQVAQGEAPTGRAFRVGGLVVPGTVQRETGTMNVSFVLTDNAEQVTVDYDRILPDLFREGQGIIARGNLDQQGRFVADEVLAKHDENYMPPEVAEALEAAGHPMSGRDQ